MAAGAAAACGGVWAAAWALGWPGPGGVSIEPGAEWVDPAIAAGPLFGQLGGYGALGLAGLALVRRRRARRMLIAAAALDGALALALLPAKHGALFRASALVAPVLFAAAGCLLAEAWRRARAVAREECRAWRLPTPPALRLGGRIAAWAGAVFLLAALAFDAVRIAGGAGEFPPRTYRANSISSTAEVERAAQWISSRASQGGLAAASHVGWLLGRMALSPIQLCVEGRAEAIAQARFVLSHEAFEPVVRAYGMERWLGPIFQTWPLAFADGTARVYRNPAFSTD
ncbi:MAG: hypothetical protein BWZ10_02621 [candidate division BRC1 bacterium ADurb.BinA364]|nr:MAG: hypothetical protein BWZ10_02621 [candidate division BRC1 bacterium ADurb.BinA364]